MSLDAIFRPKRVAVLGASVDPSKAGNRVIQNLERWGFPGEVIPINATAPEVRGRKTVRTVRELPAGVDLLISAIPAAAQPGAMADAVAAGIKAAIVLANGFSEAGPEGRKLEDELIAAASGLRFVGPNGLGVRNFHWPMHATQMLTPTIPEAGPIAFVSQSGALGNAANAEMAKARIGFSKFVSVGNMANLAHDEVFLYLADDPETSVIMAFIEGVPDPRAFLDAIAAVTPKKPIVVLKGGRTEAGQNAALSHTSAIAGNGRIWVDLMREAGATVVEGIEDLIDVAASFARAPSLPRGRRAAIFTLGGGAGVIATDHCVAAGFTLPDLSPTLEPIRHLTFKHASLRNPVDTSTSFPHKNFPALLDAIAKVAEVDAILAIGIGPDIPEFAQALIESRSIKPVVGCLVAAKAEEMLVAGAVPNLPTPERAVRVLRHFADRGIRLAQSKGAPGRLIDCGPLKPGVYTEAEAKQFLARHGLPVTRERVVNDGAGARAAARAIGYPVALKVSSSEVMHKSDSGGVLLGIADDAALERAVETLGKRFPGAAMLVQQMAPAGIELIIGAERREDTGAVVMVGIGGIFTEVLDDALFCRAPLGEEGALAAIANLRTQRLLDGFRGLPPVDRKAIAAIVATLSAMVAGTHAILEVDLNPVIAGPNGPLIVDALIRVEEA